MSLKAWWCGFTENINTARARPKAATESLMRCEVQAAGGQSLWRNLMGGDLSVHQVIHQGCPHGPGESGTDTYTGVPLFSVQ